jgi:predicted acyltransferase
MGFLAFTIAIYIGDRHGSIPWMGIGGLFGTDATIVLAGVLVGTLFRKEPAGQPCNKIKFMFWLGAGLYAAGMLIRPLHGISKDNGTDAYALVTAGECCLLFLVFHWIMDVRGFGRWAAWLVPAGVNPLLAYILPDVFSSFLDLVHGSGLVWRYSSGLPGIANGAFYTAIILALTALLTKAGVRLKL